MRLRSAAGAARASIRLGRPASATAPADRQAGQIMSDTAVAGQGAKLTSPRSILPAATGASRAHVRHLHDQLR